MRTGMLFGVLGGGACALVCVGAWAGPVDPDCAWTLTASGPLVEVNDFATFDDGTGRTLYACGKFNFNGTDVAANLLRWDGSSWSYAGTNFPPDLLNRGTGLSLSVFEENGSNVLYVGGLWTPVGGGLASAVARWNGAFWDVIPPEVVGGDGVDTAVFDDGSGLALFVGGGLTLDNKASFTPLVKWDGASWSDAAPNMTGSWIYALAVFNDGTGAHLYAGGDLTIDGQSVKLAKWNGSAWAPVPGGPINTVNTLTVHDDGSGPALFAGSLAVTPGASAIRRWDGTAWTNIDPDSVWNSVDGLASFDDEETTRLYATGSISINNMLFSGVARYWDGSSWLPVGDRFERYNSSKVATYDDGLGPAVFMVPVVVRGSSTVTQIEGISRYVRWRSRCPDAFRADYLRDCRLNFFDIRTFLTLFITQDPAADFNGDGVFDFADVAAFVDAFAAGCP